MLPKKKRRSPRLEVKEDATVYERVEAVTEYFAARCGSLSDDELVTRKSEAAAKLREVEDDLDTADAGAPGRPGRRATAPEPRQPCPLCRAEVG
jgi:hypothetical protein